MRCITFIEAVREAMNIAMENDPRVICSGLGVDDPGRIFGTTTGLQERFGKERVFDTPTSENAMTGIGVGVSLAGFRPVMVHQRLDFFLLAMDQLVNSAAKWHYMFGGQNSVPIVIRLIIGRGWGQGPTHSQNMQAWFGHIPGLKVVMPVTPADAKGLLLESIFDDNPVLFLEHRWLHKSEGDVPEGDCRTPLGTARIAREGEDVTLIAMSYMTVEAQQAAAFLQQYGISCEVIDLRSIRPLDMDTVLQSVEKTGCMIALDTGIETGSVAGEIIAQVTIRAFSALKKPPLRIAMPDNPEPASFGLTRYYHPGCEQIVAAVAKMFSVTVDTTDLSRRRSHPHDIPGDWFRGPF